MNATASIDLTWLPIGGQDFNLSFQSRSGGRSLARREDLVFADNAFWMASISVPPQFDSQMRRLRSVMDQTKGRAGVLDVRVVNRPNLTTKTDPYSYYRNLGISEQEHRQGFTPFHDGSLFSDGNGFALPEQREPRAVYGCPVGGRRVTLDGGIAEGLEVGDMFSHADSVYRIASRTGMVFTFEPGLRTLLDIGQAIEVSAPMAKMRLTSDDGGMLSSTVGLYTSTLNLELEEVRP